MILHRLEARYRREHTREPVVLNTPDDVDALVDALLAAPKSHNMAQLHSAERPLLPSGYHDHELLAGVDGELQVGVLAFMDMSAEQGNVVTLSSSEGRGEVSYSIAGAATEFPDRSEVPIDLVRQAIKEFLLSGGKRPRCVEWHVPEIW